MTGNVVDPLRADIDRAAVAHPFELFLAIDQHIGLRDVMFAGDIMERSGREV